MSEDTLKPLPAGCPGTGAEFTEWARALREAWILPTQSNWCDIFNGASPEEIEAMSLTDQQNFTPLPAKREGNDLVCQYCDQHFPMPDPKADFVQCPKCKKMLARPEQPE